MDEVSILDLEPTRRPHPLITFGGVLDVLQAETKPKDPFAPVN